ncbi:MAG: endonuclease, partial [bacterium]|nr:endonuclease [bacterium]
MPIKKIFTIACLATSALYIQAADHCCKSLNIVSYNVRNGIGIDNVNNLSRTISTLRSTSPEIVCLQELDSVTG